MNEKFNKNAKVEKFTNMLGIALRLIVIDPLLNKSQNWYMILQKCVPIYKNPLSAIRDHVLNNRNSLIVPSMDRKNDEKMKVYRFCNCLVANVHRPLLMNYPIFLKICT